MSLLIKNGRIITAEQDYVADIFIERDTISLIGSNLQIVADTLIDAAGKYVIPGGIDVHTHLDMPMGAIVSSDDYETGTIAAAFGGTTTIVDFATQDRGGSIRKTFDEWMSRAEGKATIDYGFHMIVTDLPETKMDDLTAMVHEGVTSFKLFMAYPQSLMVDDSTIFRIMQHAGKLGAMVSLHAENGSVIDNIVKQAIAEGKTAPHFHALTRPAGTEAEAVHRAIALAELAEAPVYIVHVSTAEATEEIAAARHRGTLAFGETCPQYLFLSVEDYTKQGFEDAKLVFTPPPREKWNQDELWAGLKTNSLQVVATDHCPFHFCGHKDIGKGDFRKIPNGGPGIEHRLQLLFDGGVLQNRISLNRWVEINAATPAKIFGMFPKKGTIAVGSDADIVIWDPEEVFTISAKTHHMRVDYSLYEGRTVKGNAEVVISRGDIIVKDKQFTGAAGRGNFLKRGTCGTTWY